jgi:hypothetical protein
MEEQEFNMVQTMTLPDNWGEAILFDEKSGTTQFARSYDNFGRQLVWKNNFSDVFKTSCDVECIHQPKPFLVNYFNCSSKKQFFLSWVATEAVAKLFDVPILYWLKKNGMNNKILPIGKSVLASYEDTEYEIMVVTNKNENHFMAFAKKFNLDLITSIC